MKTMRGALRRIQGMLYPHPVVAATAIGLLLLGSASLAMALLPTSGAEPEMSEAPQRWGGRGRRGGFSDDHPEIDIQNMA